MVVRLFLFQPKAHFRYPFSLTSRFTYPLPPFSTIFGFIANLLGYNQWNSNENRRKEYLGLIKNSKFAVVGSYDLIGVERCYWFRNPRFDGSISREAISHPGTQSPSTVFIIKNLATLIYVGGALEEKIKNASFNEIMGPLSLGRAEDIITEFSIQEVELREIKNDDLTPYFPLRDPIESKKYKTLRKKRTVAMWCKQDMVRKKTPCFLITTTFCIENESRLMNKIPMALLENAIRENEEGEMEIEEKKWKWDPSLNLPIPLLSM